MNWFYPVVSLAVLVGGYGGFRYWKKRQAEKALTAQVQKAKAQVQKAPVAQQGAPAPVAPTVVPEPVVPDPVLPPASKGV